jgi:DNA polymerase-1
VSKQPTLYLIDGFSLAFRAFYALPPMTNAEGFPTNMIYGFLNTLSNVILDEKPDYFAVAFDRSEPTRRDKLYPSYKAHRKEAPDEFKQQVQPLKDFLKVLQIPMLEVPGFEADDILGTMAKLAVKKKIDVKILTGDRDLFQVVNEHVQVVYPGKGIAQTELITPEKVKEKLGVAPDRVIDLKGLMGDSSDNIPGIPGVGPKTALKLLEQFGSLKNVLKNTNKIENESLRKKVQDNVESAQVSESLATVDLDVPLTEPFKQIEFKQANWKAAFGLFQKYELMSLIKRLQKLGELGDELPLFALEPQEPESTMSVEERFEVMLIKYLLNPEKGITEEDVTDEDLKNKKQYWAELEKYGLDKVYKEIDMPLRPVLLQMRQAGMKIDLDYLKAMSKTAEKVISKLEKDVHKMAGSDFNVASPKQLAEVLFDKMKIKPLKKTKTGFSTDNEVLESLATEHPIAEKIIEYRLNAKLKSTYVDALPRLVDENDFVHSDLRQTIAATGRLSSIEPNLQNIPIRTELGRKIRAAFISRFKGGSILSADYSQIELRILAHMTEEPALIESYRNNEDIHRRTASEVFNVPLESVTSDQRAHAKAVNFGIAYGMGANGLAKSIKVSNKEAKAYIDKYFERYPRIRLYIEGTKKYAHDHGYVKTMFGRIRFLKEINGANPMLAAMSERAAINAPIQGSAADLVKLAMIAVAKKITGFKSQMVLQVHDELLFDVEPSELEQLKIIVKHEMEQVYQMQVPLVVDLHQGVNWMEASK